MTPDVTVVIPTRNRRDVLATTLVSVLSQTVPVRVVVVDEASSDGTDEWLDRLDDERVTSVRNDPPLGSAGARNVGLEQVETGWVAFCDDDDLWAPDKVAEQLAAMDRSGARWCAVGSVLFEGDRFVGHQRPGDPGDLLERLLSRNVVPGGGSGVLARTELVRDAGGFRVEQDHAEDWDLWIRLAQRSPAATVDRPLVAYRVWESSSRDVPGMAAAFEEITGRYRHLARERGLEPDRDAHDRWLAKQRLRDRSRLRAAAAFARLGRRGHRLQYVRAVAALVSPRLTDRFGSWRAARAVPSAWADEVRAWLVPLQAGVLPAHVGA